MKQGLIQIAVLLSAIASADTHLGPVTDLAVLGKPLATSFTCCFR